MRRAPPAEQAAANDAGSARAQRYQRAIVLTRIGPMQGGSGHQMTGSKRRLLGHRVVGSMCRHRAGRDGDSEHLGDGGVVKAVLHLGDRPHHAMLGGPGVGGRLQRRLVRAEPRFLVDLGARIPEQNLRGDVAGDWLAAGVKLQRILRGYVLDRTVKISSAWADISPAKSNSVASTDIFRVLCDMVVLLH